MQLRLGKPGIPMRNFVAGTSIDDSEVVCEDGAIIGLGTFTIAHHGPRRPGPQLKVEEPSWS